MVTGPVLVALPYDPGVADSMELKVTQYDVRDRVATITLDRPARLNAWTGRMHSASPPLEPSSPRLTGSSRGSPSAPVDAVPALN